MSVTDKLTVGDVTVKMTFGLLLKLMSIVPSVEALPTLAFDRELAEKFLSTMFSTWKYDEASDDFVIATRGKSQLNSLSLEEVESALDWGRGHLLGFFIRQAGKAKEQMDQATSALEKFSTTGSEA